MIRSAAASDAQLSLCRVSTCDRTQIMVVNSSYVFIIIIIIIVLLLILIIRSM